VGIAAELEACRSRARTGDGTESRGRYSMNIWPSLRTVFSPTRGVLMRSVKTYH
jgi:hypothetical protein